MYIYGRLLLWTVVREKLLVQNGTQIRTGFYLSEKSDENLPLFPGSFKFMAEWIITCGGKFGHIGKSFNTKKQPH